MGKLSFIIVLILLGITASAQSPHGTGLKTECIVCHTSKDWKVTSKSMTFDHNTTSFKLTGQHQMVDCKSCHQTLIFQNAKSECISCHTDIHESTLGPNCARCHNTEAWIIQNPITMHQQSRFPLLGNHAVADCASCHKSASKYQYEQLGVECINCHKTEYMATTQPNHQKSFFPENCIDCHDINATNWKASNFKHDQFPLTGGHNIDCINCHKDGTFQKISNECVSCHQANFNSAKGHIDSKFSTNCTLCHTTSNWIKTSFNHATSNFPLTGAHTTVDCILCHTSGYAGTPMDCNSCHQAKYTATQTPGHVKAGIPVDCKTCHTTTAWQPSTFNHSTTIFPLTGAHKAIVQCSDCHLGSVTTAKPECISCHQVQYNGAKDHVASKFPTDCTLCHNTTDWLQTTFDHSKTNFPLTGAHISVECATCHTSGTYAGAPVDCNSCHQAKYTATQTPSHTKAGIPVDCKTCHTTTAWQPSTFNHSTTIFPLTGAHTAIVQCSDCHLGSVTTAKPECVSCHQTQYNSAKGHVTSKFPTDCTLCHNTTDWLQTTFDHSKTSFPLTGAHISVDCALCHTTGYVGTSTDCNSCHQAKYTATQTPSHTKAGIPVDCKTCHTTTAWQPSTFNHSTTIFPLTGAHTAIVQCSDCHLGSVTTAKPECVSCHQTQYNSAKGHVTSKFPTDCTLCHNTTDWLQTTFDHSKTSFPLTGAHTTVDCALCHTTGYVGTSTDCNSCHQAKYTATQTPSHTKAGIPVDCKTCHTTTAWQPSTFNHSTTIFPLTGAHTAIVQCSDCHLGSVTTAKPECVSCHQTQYNSAKGHVTSKFPTDCTLCHNTTDWLQTTFDHSKTSFPLTGAHISVDCALCHTTGYVGTSTDCNSCHQAKYTATQTPSHTKAGIPVDCKTCHTTTAWQPSTFNHSTTIFPLTGAHTAIVQCSDCHLGSVTTAKPECVSCHQTQYNSAKGHVTSKFPTDCTLCHNTTDWLQTTFDHSKTSFPLTGAHTTVDCALCHTTGYVGTSTDCNSCHQAKYTATQTPSHTKAGIPVDCKTCHTTTAWQPSTFNHSTTIFPLTGAHTAIVQCSDCHLGSVTTAKPECVSCHQTQYNSAKGHVTSKFPTDCTLCHNTTDWLQTTFDHSKTSFPLTGAHISVDCALCHTTGYVGTSTDCNSCHQAKYTATQTPSHTKAGIPVDCKTCHTTTAWQPSTFNHSTTIFPLTGAHTAIVQCSDCHLGSVTTAKPECVSCHQTQYNSAKGHVTSKFPTDCTLCHNTTDWLQTTFDHSKTSFPLTGAHTTVDCALCHTTGYVGTSTDCNSCHQAKYTATQTPSHTKAGIPVDCKTCHTTTAWQPSTFNHSTTIFPLTGAHTAIVQCSDCHLGSVTTTSPECVSCHQAKYTAAQTPSHTSAGIPADCKTCHNTTAWQPSIFNHATTGFTLTGAHAAIVQCSDCHKGNITSATPDCISCHQVQYNGAKDHVASKFPTDCRICHNMNNWLGVTFDHNTTQFPLTGAHVSVDCASCHSAGYVGISTACSSCHLTNYNSTTNPNHKTLGLSLTCTDCHTTNPGWQPASFPIHSNYYVLTGFHTSVDCASCHKGVYPNTPKTCYGCHAANYTSAKNPPHLDTNNFTTDCASCHTTTAWAPSTFNHTSYFPITSGNHHVNCTICHTTPTNFTQFTCVTSACHSRAHNQSQGSAGCYRCHPTGRAD